MKALREVLKTVIDTLRVVGQSRGYTVYPALAFLIILLITFTAIIPLLERLLGAGDSGWARLLFFLAVYLAYGLLYFVVTFGNVALVAGIAARLDGGEPDLALGLARASQRIGLIGIYTLVSATLGLLAFLARTLINPIFGMFVAPLIGKQLWVRWQRLSYTIPLLMEVPVIALDQPAPRDAYKRGDTLVKATWGERVKPAHSVGLLALLVLLPIIILVATPALQQGAATHDHEQFRRGLSVMLLAISSYTQLSALVNAIFALAAYRYATALKRDVVPDDPTYAEQAFAQSSPAAKPGAAPAVAEESSS